jgi:cob(I)alamin adenosyltransferase
MPIYTRTGDAGMTSIFGGKRISKADCQVETYGSIDELTSYIGLMVVKLKNKEEINFLVEIQRDLYQIMGFLSGAKVDLSPLNKKVMEFEKKIDSIESKLPKLNKFIIPGGNEISSLFQILRVLCRKAERKNIDYFNSTSLKLRGAGNQQLIVVKYLNRLSDLFFDLARKYGKNNEVVL